MAQHWFSDGFKSFFANSDLNLVKSVVSDGFFDLYDLGSIELNDSGRYDMPPAVP